MKHGGLIAKIEMHAGELTDRVLAEMYVNPFWRERFGERATKHGRQDGFFHLQYVAQALGAEDRAVMENYARWLQEVLTTRGMCSRHLAENFERLAAHIRTWPDGAPAVAMLDAATAALRYRDGAAARLQADEAAIADTAASALHARHPAWFAHGRDRCIDDLRYHLSYAADALALGYPSVFVGYVEWIAEFLARRNIPREHLAESLDALAAAAAPRVPELKTLVDAAQTR